MDNWTPQDLVCQGYPGNQIVSMPGFILRAIGEQRVDLVVDRLVYFRFENEHAVHDERPDLFIA